ncbi:hypothetical protein VAE151_560674 [Vibrio aestuarianus]|uniref:Uncharacterized protein n=1 Tax=Vibrio aestuarianus TaxID=28171 RepID=A0ABM9FSL0_9VIBR|nr:hypothetical protein VAE308_1051317 [Vibrio aestuarianus]CAH8208004.1 hypothetical protein VIBAE_A31911 [Vibrio aestuarianus subsp. francensis]CAH8205194.1 hypothetical protein VAEU17_300067 [Vibrio aestuarianus]CAH8208861.1 hypothetical protein VAE055_380668 [Vibrio aestuarianus]CAH8208863.1 hypothetical protein VAE032_271314 [Vibrio aestuarianus]
MGANVLPIFIALSVVDSLISQDKAINGFCIGTDLLALRRSIRS